MPDLRHGFCAPCSHFGMELSLRPMRNTRWDGRTGYAILLLLARLGLRAGEVVALTLDDLDWERGEILVHGKGQRLVRLPLPTDVGAALVDYLRHARPHGSIRRVFIRMRTPLRGLVGPSAIDCVVCRALKRTGLNPSFKGAHLLLKWTPVLGPAVKV